MQLTYLLFDLFVIAGPLALSLRKGPTYFVHRYTKALAAVLLAAIPWLAWDVAVAGRHWWFSEAHTLPWRLRGLPLEEWAFFGVVPLACLYTWEILLGGARDRKTAPRELGSAAGLFALGTGLYVLATTPLEYTGLSLISVGVGFLFDRALGSPVLGRPRGWWFVAAVLVLTAVFNNVLTGVPVVLYDSAYITDVRVFTMPIEDAGFGLGLCLVAAALFQAQIDRVAADPASGLVARLIRRRFGGWRHEVVTPDPSLPERPARPVRALVVGGGLAGMGAAAALAERGVSVVLRDKNPYLGGKVGAWPIALPTGEQVVAEHGFHAYFAQYWNQRALFERVGVRDLRKIGDYRILLRAGGHIGFAGTSPVPLLNLLDLTRVGVYDFWKVAVSGTGEHLEALLRYDRDATAAKWDGVSFAAFAEKAKLPPRLALVFTTFARAFFAENARISMGELIKSFHFYYLSNACGLDYDFLAQDAGTALLGPLRRHLEAHGVEIRLDSPVGPIARDGDGFVVDGERYDDVVVAADPKGARALLLASSALEGLGRRRVEGLKTGQRYAVLSLWIGRRVERDWPAFVITERARVLDAITLLDRATAQADAWARAHGGSVVEVHCYALPDDVPDADVRALFLEELFHYLPELREAPIVGEHLQIRDDFPAFHVGAWPDRPETATGTDGLVLAGDWVKLPWPAMLMEAAQMSALLAANAVLARHGVRGWPVLSVPPKGFLTGLPEMPKRPGS